MKLQGVDISPTRAARHLVLVVAILLRVSLAHADEIRVMTSGAFTAPYLEMVPEFERTTGHKVVTAFGASMGNAPDSIPARLQRGEQADIVILAADALEGLMKQGQAAQGPR